MAAKGFQIPSTCDGSLHILEDFDPSIPFDDLQVTVLHTLLNAHVELIYLLNGII